VTQTPATYTDSELERHHVLIVDDTTANIKMLANALDDLYKVTFATSGSMAIEQLSTATTLPDIILLDVVMPEMDGYEVCKHLKSKDHLKHIPVIFVTAKDLAEDEAKGLEYGAVDYITKPFSIPIVRARVQTHLSHQQLYKQIKLQNQQLDELIVARTSALNKEKLERLEAEERLFRHALFDPVTQMPNRAMFEECIAQLLINRELSPEFTICHIQLNRFQDIINTLGKQIGDQLFIRIIKRLENIAANKNLGVQIFSKNLPEKYLKKDMYLAVIEGTKLGLILNTADQVEIQSFLSSIVEKMSHPFIFMGMSLDVSILAGAASFPQHAQSVESLTCNAQIALQSAKSAIDRYVLYSDEINVFNKRRLSLMGELRKAISNNDGLSLYYQPQVHLPTNTVIAAEALIRWNHPTLGFISPMEFIPLAEKTGVIRQLNAWVVNTAAAQAAEFMDRKIPIRLSINLSATNLRESDLCAEINQSLMHAHIDSKQILLEVTETAMMHDPEESIHILTGLRESGFELSIDDFGTGYSSLYYLKKLPVQEVKIDRSFIQEMHIGSDDHTIVQTTVQMSHNLGLVVVAEGVETEEALDALRDMDCDLAQGYFIARPMPAADFYTWLKESQFSIPSEIYIPHFQRSSPKLN
jgi:EAL domain-containing protein (putative c-di-GMP-specific phosphodiesterase class I)/PleD family two-component response regulator